MAQLSENAPDRIYVELVRGLFTTAAPSLVMSLVFALCVVLIAGESRDPLILAVGAAGIVASVVRLATIALLKAEAFDESLSVARARILERRFTAAYLAFAACLGLFGALAFLLPSPEIHMLASCLMVGYCAGVAAGVGLRPGIAIPSMVIAIGPAILIAATRLDAMYVGMAVTTSVLLAAGCRSVLERYRRVASEVGKRISFESLARLDDLTRLPNRLGLREAFERDFVSSQTEGLLAVHYLDLDGFKPVNDQFGHPVGDELLAAVSRRIDGLLRAGDVVARLGGDEFAVLQRGLGHSDETEMMVQRLISALRQPFRIGDRDIRISACVGTVITNDRGADLEQLLERADQALYVAKRRGQGSAERAAA